MVHGIRHVLNVGGFTPSGNGRLIDSAEEYHHIDNVVELWLIPYNSTSNFLKSSNPSCTCQLGGFCDIR